jgi:hypothetical protein
MREMRMVMAWIFAAACLLNFVVVGRCIVYGLRYYYPPPLFRTLVITALISGAVSICSGRAWWMVRKKTPFARGWGIAASLMSIVIFIRPFIFPTQPVWDRHLGALIIGIVGIVVFLSRDRAEGSEISSSVR